MDYEVFLNIILFHAYSVITYSSCWHFQKVTYLQCQRDKIGISTVTGKLIRFAQFL